MNGGPVVCICMHKQKISQYIYIYKLYIYKLHIYKLYIYKLYIYISYIYKLYISICMCIIYIYMCVCVVGLFLYTHIYGLTLDLGYPSIHCCTYTEAWERRDQRTPPPNPKP